MERFISHTYSDVLNNNYADFVHRLKRDLDKTGLAVIEKFIAPTFLLEMVEMVEQLTPSCYQGEKRRPLIGSDLEGTIFYEIAFSESLLNLTNSLLGSFNIKLNASDVYPVVNILIGEKGQGAVKEWHFDSSYLTIAVPLVMPKQEFANSGSFYIWPNMRTFSQSKLLNKFYYNIMKLELTRKHIQHYAINFVPGNIYLFYGFRSYHGTGLLDPALLRANCLLNFGGPMFDRMKGKRITYQ